METEMGPKELFLVTYLACAWCSFGLYAVSDKTWSLKEGFAKTIHGANTGIICALLGARFIGFSKPWEIIGLACSASMGWTRKDLVINLLTKILK
jgi:hypothetical protein